MANFYLTNKAVADLSEIWNYTFDAWSEMQADHYYSLLLNTCKELAENPKLGKKYDNVHVSLLGFKVNQHIIFYTPNSQGILVVRILHSRMDMQSRLRG